MYGFFLVFLFLHSSWAIPTTSTSISSNETSFLSARDGLTYNSGERFRYINFDLQNFDDVIYRAKYERSWSDSLRLINNAIDTLDQGTADSIFNHYFPPPSNGVDGQEVAKKVYQKMRDQLEKQTNPEHNIWVNNEDFAAGCAMDGAKPPAFCYTVNADAETAKLMVDMWNLKEIREGDVVFHCCMRDLTEYMRNLDQVKCKDLGKKVSLRMDNLANTMIHEYTHWTEIGFASVDEFLNKVNSKGGKNPQGFLSVEDFDHFSQGNFPSASNGLRHSPVAELTQKTYANCDSYAWLATEIFLTKKCLGECGEYDRMPWAEYDKWTNSLNSGYPKSLDRWKPSTKMQVDGKEDSLKAVKGSS